MVAGVKVDVSMSLFCMYGPRSIQAPDEVKAPTFDDVNELTTSGALPPRMAAMIWSSFTEPRTVTVTFGWVACVAGDHVLEDAELAGAPAHPDGEVHRSCARRARRRVRLRAATARRRRARVR